MSFRQDAAHLQKLANNAFCQTGTLAALADGGTPDPDKLQKALEQAAAQFESTALEVRKLCERYSTGTGGYGSRPVLPPMEIAGAVELLGYNWLHITLNIDCYLQGKFDGSQRYSLHVGTLKTLKRDLEAEKIMGELCGVLHYYADQYVNRNLRLYTPAKQPEAEYQRQLEQEGAKQDN